MVGTILGLAGSGIMAGINNAASSNMSAQAAYRNYQLNEMAATNANRRQIQNYKNYYSPAALLRQYQEAGLSPSLMFGGTPGQGGMSAPAGAGAAGPQPVYQPMSLLEAMQLQQIKATTKQTEAETQKTKAETQNINQDTTLKEIQTKIQEMIKINQEVDFNLINAHFNKDGKETSLFELANDHYTYESFLEAVRSYLGNDQTNTEAAQRTLRKVYIASSQLNRDISVLSQEQVSANFQLAITNKLSEKGFVDQNAETVIKQLRSMDAAAELTETQKEAWNNLIDKIGKKGSTTRDIIVVLGMILSNFASHTGIKVNVGK